MKKKKLKKKLHRAYLSSFHMTSAMRAYRKERDSLRAELNHVRGQLSAQGERCASEAAMVRQCVAFVCDVGCCLFCDYVHGEASHEEHCPMLDYDFGPMDGDPPAAVKPNPRKESPDTSQQREGSDSDWSSSKYWPEEPTL